MSWTDIEDLWLECWKNRECTSLQSPGGPVGVIQCQSGKTVLDLGRIRATD